MRTALSRLGVPLIDLLQLHTWEYTDGAWLDQLEHLAAMFENDDGLSACRNGAHVW